MEASIQVPARLFEQLEVQGIPSSVSGEHLLVAMYSSGHLFPQLNSSRQVTSCVVGAKLSKSLVSCSMWTVSLFNVKTLFFLKQHNNFFFTVLKQLIITCTWQRG